MSTADICILIAIFAYLAAMIVIGIVFTKKNKSSDDFYLGGRKLGPLVTAMSAEASDMSSWLLMGLPGLAMAGRFAEASWTAIGLAIGPYLNFLIVAKRIRRYSSKIDAFTIPDFFSKRYKDKHNILSLISALIIIVFFVPYTASGFSACGKLFNTLFGMDYTTAMIISAVVIVAYTTLGGFLAASTTDLVQSIVMTVALIVVLLFGINSAGGWDQVVANVKAIPGFVSFTEVYAGSEGTAPYNALTIASTLAWGLGYFGMPQLISTHGIFPAIVAGVILAGILAATMSTADSQLLAASSSVSHNIMHDFFGIKLSEKKAMLLARISVIVISVIAVFMSLNEDSSVFRVVSFAWAGFGAAFGPVVLFALFWKRSIKWGALAGMITGGVMVFVWKYVIAVKFAGTVLEIYELLPAFILASVAIVVVSLITAEPQKEICDEFDEVKAMTD